MIISNKHKFIFIHNPKCAGQSTRQALLDYHESEIKYWDHEFNTILDRIIDKAHLWAKDIHAFEQLDLGQFFVFGFVRNPYDRFVSAFNQHVLMNPELGSLDINEFSKIHINENSIRYDWKLIHFCPQYLFFYCGNKSIVDFIGKQEKYAEDLTFISSVIGLSVEHKVVNKSSSNRSVESDLSQDTITLINKLYEKDFMLFDYPMISNNDDQFDGDLSTYRSRIERVVPSMTNAFLSLDADNQLLKEENEKSINRLLEAESRLCETQSDLRLAESEIENLIESRSWRYTAPLRKILGIGRRN